MKKPPAAPPVYRPQPVPAVLQTKKSLQNKAGAATPQAPAKKTSKAPAAYRPNPTPRVLQRKKIADHKPGAVLQTARRDPLSRAPAPALRTRAPVVQRMEQRFPYTASSIAKSQPQSGPSCWIFTGSGGEQLVIKDHGGILNVYVDGKDVGYLTYMEEHEEGQRRMRLAYIHITNQAWQGKKLSAGLIFVLCLKALQKGIDVICVGHPDAGIKAYWEAMGFDYLGAQMKQYAINLRNKDNIPEDTPPEYRVRTLAPLNETVPTEALGPVRSLLAWAQKSFFSYWR